MILFYYDFPRPQATLLSKSSALIRIESKKNPEDISRQDLDRIIAFWNPHLALRSITERFDAGAILWLIRSEKDLAGYGWTITGRTIEPHFMPLGINDTHLFDFLVFPEYRGRGINPTLVNSILAELSIEGRNRAYIEVAEWNHAQLISVGKTAFNFLGIARKRTLWGRTIVEWGNHQGRPGNKDSMIRSEP
jgi:GNAT superfamily N-acetyltransferase